MATQHLSRLYNTAQMVCSSCREVRHCRSGVPDAQQWSSGSVIVCVWCHRSVCNSLQMGPHHPSTYKDHEPCATFRRCRCSCAIKQCHVQCSENVPMSTKKRKYKRNVPSKCILDPFPFHLAFPICSVLAVLGVCRDPGAVAAENLAFVQGTIWKRRRF